VVSVGLLPLLLTLSLFSQTTKSIERAFFQNDPELLYSVLSARDHINISLPDPISFSDQVSSEQALFLFRQINITYQTFEFYVDTELPFFGGKNSTIFKARWSFKNTRNNNLYVFQVFFYLVNEIKTNAESPRNLWKIVEIKAEKL
jgi:hypothetical protein